jgi:hypothetical protein
MKNLFVLILAVLALVGGQEAAAAGCKYQEDVTDKFTKVVTRWTKWNELMNGWTRNFREYSPIISVHSFDGDVHLLLKIEYFLQKSKAPADIETENVIYVLEAAPLLIMMADESVTELRSVSEARTDAHVGQREDQGMYFTTAAAVIKYALDEETIKALSSQPAMKLRLTMANKDLDFDVHEKSIDDLRSAIQCVM